MVTILATLHRSYKRLILAWIRETVMKCHVINSWSPADYNKKVVRHVNIKACDGRVRSDYPKHWQRWKVNPLKSIIILSKQFKKISVPVFNGTYD
jgi:hypothetical protein